MVIPGLQSKSKSRNVRLDVRIAIVFEKVRKVVRGAAIGAIEKRVA